MIKPARIKGTITPAINLKGKTNSAFIFVKTSKMNIFSQEIEPEEYDGIWVNTNKEINKIYIVDTVDTSNNAYEKNSLIIKNGTTYNTNIFKLDNNVIGNIVFSFDCACFTDDNGTIIEDFDFKIYYGTGTSWKLIPIYTQLEYVTLNGDQYFSTKLAFFKNSDWEYELKFQLSNIYNYQHFFSISESDTLNEIWGNHQGIFYVRLSSTKANYFMTSQQFLRTNTDYVIKQVCENDIVKTYRNGSLVTGTNPAISGSHSSYDCSSGSHPDLPVRFGRRGTGKFKGRFYYLTIDDKHGNKRHLVPIKMNISGKIYIYDLENSVIHENLGSSDFI